MKNFKIFLESIQGLLLEANYKPLYKFWQEKYFIVNDIKQYSELWGSRLDLYNEYIDENIEDLEKNFKEYRITDESTQNWVINVFASKQQDFFTDMEKVMQQITFYDELKKHDKLSKEDKNLNKLTYKKFYEIIKKHEKVLDEENDFGNNKIIHEDGDWKIIKFTDYEDALPYVQGSKSNWCIKYKHHWDEYGAPYYAFYLKNVAYALMHIDTVQLKNNDDERFQKEDITDSFQKQVRWVLDVYLKGDVHLFSMGDFMPFIMRDPKGWSKWFNDKTVFVSLYSMYHDNEELDLNEYEEYLDIFISIYKPKSLNIDYINDLLVNDFTKYEEYLDLDGIVTAGIFFENDDSEELFKTTINRDDFDINVKIDHDNTILQRLCQYRNVHMLEILLTSKHAHKIKINEPQKNSRSMSPLQSLVYDNEIEMIRVFLKYGINLGLDLNQDYEYGWEEEKLLFKLIKKKNTYEGIQFFEEFLKAGMEFDYHDIFNNCLEVFKNPAALGLLLKYKPLPKDIDLVTPIAQVEHLLNRLKNSRNLSEYDIRNYEQSIEILKKHGATK